MMTMENIVLLNSREAVEIPENILCSMLTVKISFMIHFKHFSVEIVIHFPDRKL